MLCEDVSDEVLWSWAILLETAFTVKIFVWQVGFLNGLMNLMCDIYTAQDFYSFAIPRVPEYVVARLSVICRMQPSNGDRQPGSRCMLQQKMYCFACAQRRQQQQPRRDTHIAKYDKCEQSKDHIKEEGKD